MGADRVSRGDLCPADPAIFRVAPSTPDSHEGAGIAGGGRAAVDPDLSWGFAVSLALGQLPQRTDLPKALEGVFARAVRKRRVSPGDSTARRREPARRESSPRAQVLGSDAEADVSLSSGRPRRSAPRQERALRPIYFFVEHGPALLFVPKRVPLGPTTHSE